MSRFGRYGNGNENLRKKVKIVKNSKSRNGGIKQGRWNIRALSLVCFCLSTLSQTYDIRSILYYSKNIDADN